MDPEVEELIDCEGVVSPETILFVETGDAELVIFEVIEVSAEWLDFSVGLNDGLRRRRLTSSRLLSVKYADGIAGDEEFEVTGDNSVSLSIRGDAAIGSILLMEILTYSFVFDNLLVARWASWYARKVSNSMHMQTLR